MAQQTPSYLPRLCSIYPHIHPQAISSFQECLGKSRRVIALLGAGLSASSGLPTFRGAGGLWRTHSAPDLATPSAFEADPGLVWQFYSYRRHMALKAQPNKAHFALAVLSWRMDGFVTISQNVDGLSPRAGHREDKLHLLHGSLYDIKCSNFFCDYFEKNNFTDPIVPALSLPTDDEDPTTTKARATREVSATNGTAAVQTTPQAAAAATARELDIADAAVALPDIPEDALPHCTKCRKLLRPGVVWFGESLPSPVLNAVDSFISSNEIDLIMVIGTSARVFPAAGYVAEARAKGARVAVFNTETDLPPGELQYGDWFFQGDAAIILPELLEPIIGSVDGLSEVRPPSERPP